MDARPSRSIIRPFIGSNHQPCSAAKIHRERTPWQSKKSSSSAADRPAGRRRSMRPGPSCKPLVFEGAITEDKPHGRHAPLGSVESDHRSGELSRAFRPAILELISTTPSPPSVASMMAPHTGHGVSGPELMELMRQQARNFGTRIVTDDIVRGRFRPAPVSAHVAATAKRSRPRP